MDFRHLKQFVVLAETLNFRKAAEKLHMSQPPLSVSIRKLEAELGVELFLRGKDGVKLTESGEAALADARRALFHAGQFKQAAVAASTGEGGVLRVGFVGSATHAILPDILSRFRQRYPKVQLVLREATSIRIVQELADESLGVGVVRVPVSTDSRIRLLTLLTENFVLAMPKSHPLAQRQTLRLKDLAEEDFILYSASNATGLRMAAIHACQLAGFTPRVAQEAVQVQTVLGLVEAGLGLALVPSISRRFTSKQLVYKTLDDFPASASIGISLAWNPLTDVAAVRNFRNVAAKL
ncbi:LysR family transcriptional regulator [Alcaligenaceae bacterium]|nr:LysR family transcriptional regulator [Alcaligenaceae bacterium]